MSAEARAALLDRVAGVVAIAKNPALIQEYYTGQFAEADRLEAAANYAEAAAIRTKATAELIGMLSGTATLVKGGAGLSLKIADLGKNVATEGPSALLKFDAGNAATHTGHGIASAHTDGEAGGFSQYDQFRKPDGNWDWPPNLGFAGTPTQTTLPVGTRLDRYGAPSGSFLSPKGVSFEERALAPGSRSEPYYEYEVIKPLPVLQGEIAPAFGHPGGGIQILPNLDKIEETSNKGINIEWLVENRYLMEIKE